MLAFRIFQEKRLRSADVDRDDPNLQSLAAGIVEGEEMAAALVRATRNGGEAVLLGEKDGAEGAGDGGGEATKKRKVRFKFITYWMSRPISMTFFS